MTVEKLKQLKTLFGDTLPEMSLFFNNKEVQALGVTRAYLRKEYGNMGGSDLRRFKRLQAEFGALKTPVTKTVAPKQEVVDETE